MSNPSLVETTDVAEKTAVHFWKSNVAQRGHQHDNNAATKDINPAKLHLAERISAAQDWALKFKEGYLESKGITPPLLIWPDEARWESFRPEEIKNDRRIYDAAKLLDVNIDQLQLSGGTHERSASDGVTNTYNTSAENFALFQDLRARVSQQHEELGTARTPEQIDRLAAAMTFSYHRDFMEDIAHVQPSVDKDQRPHLNGSLVIYEAYPPTFVTNHSVTNIEDALQTPAQASFDKLSHLQLERQREEELALTKMQAPGYEHPSLR